MNNNFSITGLIYEISFDNGRYKYVENLIKICNTREEVSKIIGVCKEMVGKYKNITCLKNYYICDFNLFNESKIIIPVTRVGKYDLNGNLIKIYNNPTDIANEIGKQNSYIFNVLKGKRKTAFGYTYRYINNKIINKIEI